MTELPLLELSIRDHLNKTANRAMAVLDPLKVILTNYPEGQSEMRQATNNPEDQSAGVREMPFGRELFIEREDFMEDAPKKYFRLTVGKEVRFKNAYFVKCNEVVKDEDGNIVELHCTYDPETSGGKAPDGRKVKGTLHWVSAEHAIDAEVRIYDVLFSKEKPDDVEEGKDWKDYLNPESLTVLQNCKLEPSLASAKQGDRFQFERKGYFCVDKDSAEGNLVFNRTVSLKDGFAKGKKK